MRQRSIISECLIYASYYAPRGRDRLLDLGHRLCERYEVGARVNKVGGKCVVELAAAFIEELIGRPDGDRDDFTISEDSRAGAPAREIVKSSLEDENA